MDFQDFIKYYEVLLWDEGVALWKIDPELINEKELKPAITGFHVILFVMSGELEVAIQGKRQRLEQYDLVDILYEQECTLLAASDDLHAYILVMTKDYMNKLTRGGMPTTVDYILKARNFPVKSVEVNHVGAFLESLLNIKHAFNERRNLFVSTILQYQVWIFLARVTDYFSKEKEETIEELLYTDRQKDLYLRFTGMLSTYVVQEHSVMFYASALCVTPQYLRRIVKNLSGKTVHTWINEALIREIEKRLAETDMTVQQIAEELSFSEQATLTRFFKRYKGISPLKYRKRLLWDKMISESKAGSVLTES